MRQNLEIGKFLSIKEQELGGKNDDLLDRLGICTQSIHRWMQYCQYHYVNLEGSINSTDLKMDRIGSYRRAGETVLLRYIYEANIVAFLNSLHALLDSFPYLINLFIPVVNSPDSMSIKWNENFIKKYKSMGFYDELMGFMLDDNFNKVKGYVNTTKHKHLIRIANKWDHLKFEDYRYRRPFLNDQGCVDFHNENAAGQDVLLFIQECHDDLIPKFFNLCKSVLNFKQLQLTKIP